MTDRRGPEKKSAIPETAGLPQAVMEPVRMVGVGARVKAETVMKATGRTEGSDEPGVEDSPAMVAAAPEEGRDVVNEGTAGGMVEDEHLQRVGLPAVPERPVLLPLIAGDLTNEVIGLVEKAAESGMVEGELIFSFQRLLTSEPYCRLKGTTFEQRINALIVRELEVHGPMPFDVEQVSGWWIR